MIEVIKCLFSEVTPVQMVQFSGAGVAAVAVGGPFVTAVSSPEAMVATELVKSGVLGLLVIVLCYAVVRLYRDQQEMVRIEREEARERESRMRQCVDEFTKVAREVTNRD